MPDLQPGERIGGRYVLQELLGIGGMGEVWLAELIGAGAFRRRVVLKLLAPERRGDPRLAAMLADEARVVGMLHHPAIVGALDYVEDEEHGPVFVLDFVDGTSLRNVLKLARRDAAVMPETLAAHIGSQVAHALHAAHTAVGRDGHPLGVVHRDVAPDNVLLSRTGAVYLGDFGVARAEGNADVTQPGAGPKGKRGYMAPEQAMGRKVGPAADIFALGRVVAEAADVGCGAQLRKVLEKATAERPSDRYASASEMAVALLRACPPPTDPDRELARWLGEYVPEALVWRQTSPGGDAVRSSPPPAGRASGSHPRLAVGEVQKPLFAAMPPPSRKWLRVGLALLLLLGVGFVAVAAPRRAARLLSSALAGSPPAAHGVLKVTSRPDEAEVYVDGTLRGSTPLSIDLSVGAHAVRVGAPRIEHWRAADVNVKDNTEHHLDVDLSE
ncbi:MAG TPA: serine/threonine-protein kinase [Myxococcales bacterium]|nr:serine/threonine-protein kinase [Myxococcales bacterium]